MESVFTSKRVETNKTQDVYLTKLFAICTILGTMIGGMTAVQILRANLAPESVVCAMVAYAAVGAIGGWLVGGFFDVIRYKRLEIDAPLTSVNATSGVNAVSDNASTFTNHSENTNESTLPKAS